jgi:DNA-binding response OmpR family regulator
MSNAKGTVLLVDDDPAILLTIGDELASDGYNVVRAETAEQCLLRLKTVKPDLIILDLAMPGMGGLSFLRQISRADGSLPHPVLVFTARSELDQFFTDTRVDGFLAKTCEPGELLHEVARVIQKHRDLDELRNQQTGKWKVVITEDDVRLGKAFVGFFETAGYHASLVSNGYELIEKAIRDRPNVIILKYILPQVNGPAVAGMLEAMPSLKTIPVVLYDDSGLHAAMKKTSNVRAFVPNNLCGDLAKAVDEIRGTVAPSEAG